MVVDTHTKAVLTVIALALVALLPFAGCAVPSGPVLDDAQRCARFGGTWTGNTCAQQSRR